jgi:transcriptional regulator with PAS, ATPase and Fis domain
MDLKEDHKSTSLIKELQLQNEEKEKRIAELVLANKELQIQNEKKDKLAAELLIANKDLSYLMEKKDRKDEEFTLPADKLENNNNQFQLMVESIKDYAIFMLDTKGRIASWNSGAENIKGYTAAEIIGQPIDVFYTNEQLQLVSPKKTCNKHYGTANLKLKVGEYGRMEPFFGRMLFLRLYLMRLINFMVTQK